MDTESCRKAPRIRVELGGEINLSELQATIDANAQLVGAELIFHHSLMELPTEEVRALIASLSRRPELRELTLTSEAGLSYYTLPINFLSVVLDLAPGLLKIEVGDVQLSGTAEDFASLQNSFQNQSSLKELSCSGWLSEETRIALSQDSLLTAIAASRSLESLTFRPSFTFGGISNVTAGMLCVVATLKVLKITNCNLVDENVVAMATSLQENHTLVDLRLSCRLEAPGSRAIANTLRRNTKLEALIIHNTDIAIGAQSDSADSSSESNRSPTGAGALGDINDLHFAEIAHALKSNRSLKIFALQGTKLSLPSQKAFAEMLRQNYSLHAVSLLDLHCDLQDEVDMHTLLNRSGRADLVQEGSERQQWVDAMASVRDSLDCLFYLLCRQPSLCNIQESRKRGGGKIGPCAKRSKNSR